MQYEHKTKAGNLGDVFKHLALIQLLEGLLTGHQGKSFCYADTFAGSPEYPIALSKGWRKGAGRLLDIDVPPIPAARFWHQHIVGQAGNEPTTYPGSSLLANELIGLHGFKSHLMLWDTAAPCIHALRNAYPHAKYLAQSEVKANDVLLEQADFIMIDPPGLRSKRHPEYQSWQSLAQMLAVPVPMLMWLPIPDTLTSNGVTNHRDIRHLAVSLNLTVTEVIWNSSGMLGCQLLYRASPQVMGATRDLIEWMAAEIQCQVHHFDITTG